MAFVVALLGAVVPSAADAQSGWTTFAPAAGRFTVSVPSTPTLSTSKDSSPVGEITEYTYTVNTPTESFTLNYQDLPELAVMFGGTGRIYGGARDGCLKDAGGTLISFTKVQLDTHNGMQLLYQAPSSEGKPAQQGRVRMFLVGRRLFVVAATWPQGASAADADQFFNSFKIVK